MVGPSMSDEERAVASRRLRVGFVLLVGLSGGLVSLQAGPTLVQFFAAVLGGLLVGWLLLWFLVRMSREISPEKPKRPR
jgi:hypothetical protein